MDERAAIFIGSLRPLAFITIEQKTKAAEADASNTWERIKKRRIR